MRSWAAMDRTSTRTRAKKEHEGKTKAKQGSLMFFQWSGCGSDKSYPCYVHAWCLETPSFLSQGLLRRHYIITVTSLLCHQLCSPFNMPRNPSFPLASAGGSSPVSEHKVLQVTLHKHQETLQQAWLLHSSTGCYVFPYSSPDLRCSRTQHI